MSELERAYHPLVIEDRRSRFFICLKSSLRILQVLLPLAVISLAVYAIVVSSTKTGYGTCPSEYNSVFAGHCVKEWSFSLKGPLVQCDTTSEFNVPYWYRAHPLCTSKEVNILTTLLIVLAALFVFVASFYTNK
jgi:hypothetical protein